MLTRETEMVVYTRQRAGPHSLCPEKPGAGVRLAEEGAAKDKELTVLSRGATGLLLLPEAAALNGITSGSSCYSANAPLPTKASVLSLGEDTSVASRQEGPASVGGSRTSARSCGQVCEASMHACTLARTL